MENKEQILEIVSPYETSDYQVPKDLDDAYQNALRNKANCIAYVYKKFGNGTAASVVNWVLRVTNNVPD